MPPRPTVPLGYSPVWLPAGLPQPGENADLQAYRWRGYGGRWGTADLMLQTDGLIAACAAARVQGVQDLRPRVEPWSEDQRDVDAAEWVSGMLDGIEGGWASWVASATMYALFGARYFEPVYRRDGDLWMLSSLDLRPLRTVMRWDPDGYRWAMVQWMQPSGGAKSIAGGQVTIPAERLIGLRYRPEGNDPEPYGQLRACYGPWLRRGRVWVQRTDALERGAYGIPRVEVDVSAPGYDPSQADAVR